MAEPARAGYVRVADAGGEGPVASAQPAGEAARFALLYESRDGRLCLFEDAEGHLTSVDANRFA